MAQTSQRFYDNKYHMWDDMKWYGPASRHTRRIILKWLDEISVTDIIDISCGGAQLLSDISNKYASMPLTGTEFTLEAIESNRVKYPTIKFEYFDFESNKTLQKRDLVLCIDVLEHIADDNNAISLLKTLTGKYLLIAVPLGKLSNFDRISLGHIHGYTEKEILEKLTSGGFKITKVLNWGFPFYSLLRLITNGVSKNLAEGKINFIKQLVFTTLYYLYFINLPFHGGRLFVLCEPLTTHETSI